MKADGRSDVTFSSCIILFILYTGDLRPSPTKSMVKSLIKKGGLKKYGIYFKCLKYLNWDRWGWGYA